MHDWRSMAATADCSPGPSPIAWVMLWDQVTIANIAAGLLVGAGMLIVFPLPGGHEPSSTVRPVACIRLAAGVLASS